MLRFRAGYWAGWTEVKYLADLDAGGNQLVAGGLDVGNDQVCSLG
jgi:hypothetical protein